MKDHQLGPNGAILTALNLFTSQPEKIVARIEEVMKKSENESNIFVVDIPGQIEVFTWSSSSLILTESIALLMPVKIVYIIDSVRCQNPNVFLSNLLFARTLGKI
jgi:GTPase SAR1 family protein